MDQNHLTLEIEQQIEIQAPLKTAFDGLIRQLTERNVLPMRLEPWPGGRWFRDLGDGAGHLWGFVQVIKPPTLLEIYGPLFMSYPAVNHLQFRLAEVSAGTKLTLRHRAFGLIEDAHRQGVAKGWQEILSGIQGAGK